MAIDRKAAFSRMNLSRRLDQGDDERKRLQTSRRLESASIGRGGLSVHGGGDITVDDGGSFQALNGSQIVARYADGSAGVLWGSLIDAATGNPTGHGLLIQSLDGDDIFRAKRSGLGEKQVFIGSAPAGLPEIPVDEMLFESLFTRIRSYGLEDAFFATFEGGDAVVAASGGGDAALRSFDGGDARVSVIDTGGDVRLTNPDFRVFTAYESDSQTANCHLTVDGQIIRTGSSRRIKKDIRDAQIDTDAVLRLQPRTWLPADEVTGYAGAPPEERKNGAPDGRRAAGKKKERVRPPRPQARQVGFVAEELDDIGLGQFVEHDENGEAISIAYDRLTAALVTLCQRQQTQIDGLTAWAVAQGFQPPGD